jgi:hypothetical protein
MGGGWMVAQDQIRAAKATDTATAQVPVAAAKASVETRRDSSK